ncbi:MAG: PorV/PorQ family protein [Candidatus Delongbacteria bacterium]|nr:PorV/PorQ family protein [Candidatus Delongbacteria bacterium]
MKKLILTVLIISSYLFADGKYAGEFISSGTEARSLALGNIVLTSFNSSSASYFNPAYLPLIQNENIQLSHSERFEGLVRQEFASFKTEIDGHDVGFSFIWMGIDNITLTKLQNEDSLVSETNRILPDKYVNDNEFALFASLGKRYNDNLFWGVNIKLLYKTFEEESAVGLGTDISGLYFANHNITLGIKIQDITTSTLFWTTGLTEVVRPSILFNAEYNNRIEYFLTDYKIITGTKIRTENYAENSFASLGAMDFVLSTGLELKFKKIFIRGGYNTDNTWSAGSGLDYKGITLDYAFKPDFEDLGNTHKISLAYSWE